MKKRLLILFGIVFLCCTGFGFESVISLYNVAGGGGACDTLTFSHTGTPDTFRYVSRTANDYYSGAYITFAQAGDKCKAVFTLTATGTISGYTYSAIIANRSGSDIDIILATSNGVVGNDSWSQTEVAFEFSSPPTVTTDADTYIIALTAGEVTGTSNYLRIESVTGGSSSLYGAYLDAAGTLTGGSANDILVSVYE
jgi:hypothetical protein